MKRNLLILSIVALAATLSAAPRSADEARRLALQHMQSQPSSVVPDIQLVEVPTVKHAPARLAEGLTAPTYYAFSDASTASFVVVSGSTLTPAILAYGADESLTAADATAPLPEGLSWWLNAIDERISQLEASAESAPMPQRASMTAVKPMLDGIKWSQDEPFSNSCPAISGYNCPTGCVATAMAQVIRYYKNPSMGKGSHSYVWEYAEGGKQKSKTISLALGDQRFDYMLMPKEITKKQPGTAAEQKEVAKLCYSCGVAVNMQYGLDGSGTNSYFINEALISHFGYNSLTAPIQRSGYGYDEWDPIIRGELQAGRPVIYSGNSADQQTGHAFVLEGYDQQGLYYVNWGWGGYYDGYYDLSILNPSGVGTGASMMSDGFCENQVAVVNISPKEGEGTYRTTLYGSGDSKLTASKSSSQLGSTVTFTASTPYNYSGTSQGGQLGVVLMRDGKEVDKQSCGNVELEGMDQQYRIEGCQVEARYTIPSNLKEGTYRLYFYFQPTGLTQYDLIRFGRSQYEGYFELSVRGKEVSIVRPSVDLSMKATRWSFDGQSVATRLCQFSVDVTNLSSATIAGEFAITLYAPGSKQGVSIDARSSCYTLPAGESRQVVFEYDFDKPGEWTCELGFKPWGTGASRYVTIDGSKRTFQVDADELGGARFKLNSAPAITSLSADGLFYRDSPIRAVVNVTNRGTDYKGQFMLNVYTKTSNPSSQTPVDYILADVECPADGAAHDITIDGLLDVDITRNTSLYVRAFYFDGSDWTLLDESLYTKINVYGTDAPSGNAIRQIEVDAPAADTPALDPWHDAEIYDILGKRISLPAGGQLPKGIYIINGKKSVIK